jgi:pyruvate kinase
VRQPAHIGCTLPDAFQTAKLGEPVWLDDGKIGGVIRTVTPEALTVEITQARPGGENLGADKGINLPRSVFQVSALTNTDIECLPLIVQHADLIGYSFVHSPDDVLALQHRLADLGGSHLGIILKIETRTAFERLPSLLLAAMRNRAAGVMIARGDLAIECGFERLAEVQEEILFISEASHLPVIWATQVLEQLAQDGIPSRAEITDAAMGERAECVMLNKGPYILDAVRALDNILRRMQDHQDKKSAMLRQLSISQGFFSLG